MITNGIGRRTFLQNVIIAFLVSRFPFTERVFAGDAGKPVTVRVHDPAASRPWDYSLSAPWNDTVEPRSIEEFKSGKFRKDRYFDYINESVVRSMFQRGLCELTGMSAYTKAWKSILNTYKRGDKITIKINLNNATYDERVTTNRLDQSAPLINAVIAGLTENLSAPEEDITIADPSRWIHPEIITARVPYRKIRWIDSGSPDLWDSRETVKFTKDRPVRPRNVNPKKYKLPDKVSFNLAKVYAGADHIINLCLMKNHGCGVSGAMKNHFGAIPPLSPKFLHTGLGEKSYIADVCNTPSIRNKVRLNVCDAVFANWHDNVWCPRPWKTFSEHSPNSLFLGTDPVAFDSVLLQHITDEVRAQGTNAPQWVREAVTKHQFLQYAMEHHGLGIHEHKPYSLIDYRQIENA